MMQMTVIIITADANNYHNNDDINIHDNHNHSNTNHDNTINIIT